MPKYSLRRKEPVPAPLRRLPEDELAGSLAAHQQWLETEELAPRDGKPADFSDADLRGHDFSGANLKHANFQDADLRKANFSGADLTEAEFRGANLAEANLSGTVGLFAEQLSDTNLRRAKMPDQFSFESLAKANRISESSHRLLVPMLFACVYSWLTIGSTKDPQLLTNSSTSNLPVINVEIPIVGFYWLAPLVLLGLYVYFHINLQRLWEFITTLPAIFPDGVTIDRKIETGLLIDTVRKHYKYLKPSPLPLSWLQEKLSIFLAWWVVPLTIAWFWIRYLARHDWTGTLLHVALLTTIAWAGTASYKLAIATLADKKKLDLLANQDNLPAPDEPNPDKKELDTRQKLMRATRWLFGCFALLLACPLLYLLMRAPFLIVLLIVLLAPIWAGIAYRKMVVASLGSDNKALEAQQKLLKTRRLFGSGAFVTACGALFLFISACAIYSPPVVKRDYLSVPADNLRLPNGDDMPEAQRSKLLLKADPFANDNRPGLWVSKAFNLVGYSPVANFRYAKVSTGDADNLKSVTGANLRDTDLNSAQCQYAMLAKASFINANLSGAVLDYAHLEKAIFFNADLSNASLAHANLQGALILHAKLQGAYWGDADLRHAQMSQAGLRGADLKNAKLQDADLTGADLSRAKLDGANLAGATLSGPATDGSTLYADLRGTDLRQTKGLTVKQIQSAIIGIDYKTNSMLLSVDDLNGAGGMIGKLKVANDPVSRYLKGQFSAAFWKQLQAYTWPDPFSQGLLDEQWADTGPDSSFQALKLALVDELNRIIQDKPLYDKARFAKVKLGRNTQWQLANLRDMQQMQMQQMQGMPPQSISGEDLIRLNRLLLTDAYPGHIVSEPETKLPSYLRLTAPQIKAALRRYEEAKWREEKQRIRQQRLRLQQQSATPGPM